VSDSNVAVKAGGSGLSLFTLAALILLVLKLTAYPAISWWWVFGVFLFPFAFVVGILLLILAFVLFIMLVALALPDE
jgi:hypothetical protein